MKTRDVSYAATRVGITIGYIGAALAVLFGTEGAYAHWRAGRTTLAVINTALLGLALAGWCSGTLMWWKGRDRDGAGHDNAAPSAGSVVASNRLLWGFVAVAVVILVTNVPLLVSRLEEGSTTVFGIAPLLLSLAIVGMGCAFVWWDVRRKGSPRS
jgi:hypothetical protein